MYKVAVFDLDGTLADLGHGITMRNLEMIHAIEHMGMRVAICSGKPAFYLSAILRQLELLNPIYLGENGAVIQYGLSLPPDGYHVQNYSDLAKETIRRARMEIEELIPGIFFQPNEVGLTPFPKSEEEFEIIQNYLDSNKEWIKDVVIYRHADCFDLTPVGIDKQSGVKFLAEIMDVGLEEMITIGNGVNDYPMFEVSGYSIGINLPDPSKVDKNFKTLTDALLHVIAIGYRE